jgi:CRISPR/Cas system-associated exonuclease Cas4 (RecB family)
MALATAPLHPVALRNPAQEEVLALLGTRAGERPTFEPPLRDELRTELEAGLHPVLDALPEGEVLRLSKYPLAQVHGCEARFLAQREQPFAWTVASARGTIAHKAVELSIHWPAEPRPLELVDEAVERLIAHGGSLAEFLLSRPPVERAELRAEANDRVAKFLECFPPLRTAWRPVTESSVRIDLFAGRVVLQGRVDLTLGQARGPVAGKVLIDLKTGGFAPGHVDDLRFYALLETLRIGTPPVRLATYYLDSGRPHPEPVTADTLRAAVRRTVDGAIRLVEICHHDHPPVRRPGPACRWCPLRAGCADAGDGGAWPEEGP